MILFYLLPLAVILHIIEEFVFPGGFSAWYGNYKQYYAASATSKYLIIVNAVLVVLCLLPLFLDTPTANALWLSMASVIFFNAIFHIQGFLRSRKYSPGMATSILLYIPLTIYGYEHFLSTGTVSTEQAITSSLIGPLFLVFSFYNHKRRARAR